MYFKPLNACANIPCPSLSEPIATAEEAAKSSESKGDGHFTLAFRNPKAMHAPF